MYAGELYAGNMVLQAKWHSVFIISFLGPFHPFTLMQCWGEREGWGMGGLTPPITTNTFSRGPGTGPPEAPGRVESVQD